ncbi:DNA-processing protein DprA [Pseudothermotoga thermarum]|uniref:DNA protecting protein DprA n=1 Tax=Pseudothermotoga thermarum DSM 5069 TaxID=688269 RepID=F7YX97_9THEM|nr:DNA-processing protein DprA [Pseudothermotoga thermarum]AEH51346.1 DNA protecting protein DprA [Pseudothermotoga thermarum DSM 5069]
MQPIEIFALSHFGKFKVEEIESIKGKTLKDILESDFLQGNEKFKARYDEKFLLDQKRKIEEHGVKLIDYWHEDYPKLLRETFSPPPVLFCLGNVKLLNERCISVVGTRKPTSYGKAVVKKIVSQLVQADFVIVSGLAFGIDAFAHETALELGGKTVAVLGTGVDICYPSSNRRIYEKIVQTGCLISEFPMGTKPAKYQFPMRNRIIAGLSRATIVVEAPLESGALITARQAAEMGREVFAVPGDIDRKSSEGCNWLIKMGAIPLTDCQQIFDLYGIKGEVEKTKDDFLEIFKDGPMQVEEIAEKVGLSVSEVLVKLTEYELSGKIVKTFDGRYYKS